MLTVFVVSDATGDTAQRMVRAGLVQFQDAPVRLVRRSHVRTPRQVHAVIHEAAAARPSIIHTLVSDELRRVMRAEARTHGVDALDMMGPILERLTTHLKLAPQEKPGLFQTLAEAKTREVEAVSFAFRHDDGQNTPQPRSRGGGAGGRLADHEDAHHALPGLSRLVRGQRAARARRVAAAGPAGRAGRTRVLSDDAPEKLQQLRRARAEEESIPLQPYASLDQIRAELSFMADLCRKHHWQRIDATGKSVEEVAREIIGISGRGIDRPAHRHAATGNALAISAGIRVGLPVA